MSALACRRHAIKDKTKSAGWAVPAGRCSAAGSAAGSALSDEHEGDERQAGQQDA